MIRFLNFKEEELVSSSFFVFSFDEDDFVICKNKEEMKKYLLNERIDPDDIEEDIKDGKFNPSSDRDVFFFNPHWNYEEDVNYNRLCEIFGGAEEVEEGIKDGLEYSEF